MQIVQKNIGLGSAAGWRLMVLIGLFIVIATSAAAKVSGLCSNCHTMHNSQQNSLVSRSGSTRILNSEPLQSLLNNDCVGCHTGTNLEGESGKKTGTPYVHDTGTVNYGSDGTTGNTLAGGTFNFVDASPYKGHNVAGISQNSDPALAAPPGFNGGRAAADGTLPGAGSWVNQQITCAGTYGCHGRHDTENNYEAIAGGHHQNSQGAAITTPGSSVAGGYRMLVGIAGYEDPEWEYTPTASLHNQYKGSDSALGSYDTSTISYFCSECHGQFHNPSNNLTSGGGSPWLRHPTDYDMGNTAMDSEYRNYGNGSNDYLPATPVASNSVTEVKAKITFNADTIVTCISCHRAHGSNFYKAMRWGYAESTDGELCANCHTSKD